MATPEEASSARPVEVSLAETGPPVGEEVPIEVEKVEPKVKKLRRPFGVPGGIKSIAAVLIVMVIIVTGAWAIGNRSGDSNNDDSWPKEKDIADLETGNYLNNFGFGFNEGETVRFDVFEEVLGPMYDENDLWIQVFCIYRVEVMVEWIDEPSQNIIIDRWTNDPDTFSIDIYDDLGIHDERSEDSNPLDGEGLVSVTWSSDTTLFGYGNSSLVTVKGREIDYEARIYADITLEDAGDSRSIVGRTEVDNGNECYITFKIYFFQYVDERLTE